MTPKPVTGTALVLSTDVVEEQAALPVRERRSRVPSAPVHARVADLQATITRVNNGDGIWARAGGRIGNSEIRALQVWRSPTNDEIAIGADPDTHVETAGYEALTTLFEHSPLDVQTEIYRDLSRSPPWWAWFDVFGWFKGARAPVERFEEEYDPGGPVEVLVMGLDQGSWFLPGLFKRWFAFTVGRGDWVLDRAEVTSRGGDVEAADITKRGYAQALLLQYEDMSSSQRWRVLCAVAPDLLDSPVGAKLERIDPTWFDRGRFGVAFLYDPHDPEKARRLRDSAETVREFFFQTLNINPYLVERGFDLSFVPISREYPEIPSEPIHQFVTDLRSQLPQLEHGRLDLMQFGVFLTDNYPRWPQLIPEQLRRVLEEDDQERFFHKRVDLWGEAVRIRVREYTFGKRLRHSTEEQAGRDKDGRRIYRTKTTRWTARVPAVEFTFEVRGETGAEVGAVCDRRGDAHATGHRIHRTTEPDWLEFVGGVERFPGSLAESLSLLVR